MWSFRGFSAFVRRLNWVAMAFLLIIIVFTVVAVFTRYVLSFPIPGDNELIELMMVISVFFGGRWREAELDESHVNTASPWR